MNFSKKMLIPVLVLGFGIIASAAPAGDAASSSESMVGTPVRGTSSGPVVAPPPASGLTPADLPLPSDYCSTATYHHNLHRLNHSAPTVTYSQDTAVYASQNIVSCEPSPSEIPGSNYFVVFGTGADDRTSASVTVAAIQSWYDGELANYEAATNDFTAEPDFSTFPSWGHFSQMVWATETTIGCWSVHCDASTPITQGFGADYSWQVVCASNPAGNLNGGDNYVANVHPPLGQAPSDYSIMSNNPC